MTITLEHTQLSNREARARRLAKKYGLVVAKSRETEGFMLIDAAQNFVVAGGDPYQFSFTLEDVEGYLEG